jgi:uncharacterized membrane protein
MIKTRPLTVIGTILVGCCCLCHGAQIYTLTNLDAQSVTGINNAGQILGSDTRGSFLLSGGVKQYFAQPTGGTFTPTALNNAGEVAGYVNYQNQFNYLLTTVQNGALNITGAGGLSPDAINDMGQIIGAAVFTQGGFFYSGGNVSTLGPLPYSLNNAGIAVGTTLDTNRRAFMYQNGEITYLTPPGAVSAQAYAINDSGVIAGTFSTRPLTTLAQLFIYRDGTYVEPGYAFGAAPETDLVRAVNSAGVIVGTAELSNGALAWSYDPSSGYSNLNALTNAPGWTLQTAVGINDSGQIIGTGLFNGQRNSFLLTPVPEPGVSALMLLGLGALALRCRRGTSSTGTQKHP